ncbi:MAG: SufE family protein [bacterium]
MNINDIQDKIIKEFSGLNDWMDKYEYLITLGKTLKATDKDLRIEENQIPGCQSTVWVKAELKDNKITFSADSEALITRGIIALLLRVLNNQSPEDILNADLYFIEKIGLSSNLSPSRANGLASIVKILKSLAENIHSSQKYRQFYK